MLCLCCWAFPGLTRAPYITVWVGVWGFEAGLHGVVGGGGSGLIRRLYNIDRVFFIHMDDL